MRENGGSASTSWTENTTRDRSSGTMRMPASSRVKNRSSRAGAMPAAAVSG